MIIVRKDVTLSKRLINNLIEKSNNKKRTDDVIHISDILTPPKTCIRKQYYRRKFPEEETIDKNAVMHFLRGTSSENAVIELFSAGKAGKGIKQLDLELDGIIGHPDLTTDDIVFELKSTTTLSRLTIDDDSFKSYMRQLLYYMVMLDKEKGGIWITYNTPDFKLQQRTAEGELYLRPYGSKPELDSWDIFLSKDDKLRDHLKNEIIERGQLLKLALSKNDVSILPRLQERYFNTYCKYCPYQKKCKKDPESKEAYEYGNKPDLLENKIDFDYTEAPNII